MLRYRKVRREILLPRKGYKCITVTDELHKEIQQRAKETNRTIKKYVEYLISKEKPLKDNN
jgi:hypothetical protein